MYPYLLLFTLIVFASFCKGRHDNKACSVVPKDQYIEAGSDTEIDCHTSCVHGKVFWKLNKRAIDPSLSITVNSSLTVLSLRNFTEQSATLECHSADGEILGGTIIRTYSKPSRISCILDYENQERIGVPELLRCSWEHPINPYKYTKYTVLSAQSEICTSRGTTCKTEYIPISDKIPLTKGFINITVRAKSEEFEASSETLQVVPYHMWKMIRPKLKVSARPDHLLIKWSHMDDLTEADHHCQVKYSKANAERSPEWVIDKTLGSAESAKLTVENLDSCSTYKFTVRCALDQAPWSDWSLEKRVLTQLNMTQVKLRLWRKIAEPMKNGARKVHVMWTGIPSTCEDALTYSIRLIPSKQQQQNTTGANNTAAVLCGNSTCDVDVDEDAHSITLTVLKNGAPSAEASVHAPVVGGSLPEVTDIQTSTLEGVIRVSWKAPVQPVSGYVIDYTRDGNQYHWKESGYTNITLTDLQDKTRYNITVTPLLNGTTGHGTQALGICSSVGDPANVTIVDVQAYDKSAFVSWDLKSEVDCRGAVVGYTVFYSTQSGPQLNVSLDGSEQNVYLKDLTPVTQYHVHVRATALTGTTQSSEWLFTTKRFDPRLFTALLVCVGLSVPLLSFLGLCGAVQWKKMSEKPIPNPGLSSVALWSSSGSQEGTLPILPFSDPPESCCVRVYPEEPEGAPASVQPKDSEGEPSRLQAEECTVPDVVPAPDSPGKDPHEAAEMMQLSSSGESTALLHSDSDQSSPYRSQGSVGAPAQRTSKQNKRVAVKQQEKTEPPTVYVTLDMFKTGRVQLRELDQARLQPKVNC